MRKSELDPKDGLGLLQGARLVLITTEVRQFPNICACCWITPVGLSPPTLLLSLRPESLTRRNIDQTGEFVVNVPGVDLARETAFCGLVSGRDVKKIKECGLRLEPGARVRAPFLSDGLAHLECRAVLAREVAGQILFTGEVVFAAVGSGLYSVETGWDLENPGARFLVHLGGNFYGIPERSIEINLGRPGFSPGLSEGRTP